MKVFIGVGHGGADPGAVSGGVHEADINLTMALAMRDYLTMYGVDVGISRVTDENDPLDEEIAEANAFSPDLAVEIHNNAGGGDGWECYRQTNTYSNQSLRVAGKIEARVKEIGQNSRGIKTKFLPNGKDWFGWCRLVDAPAVLCEGFFIDNPIDAQDFRTVEQQEAMGVAYAKGVLDYFGIKLNPDTGTGKAYRVQTGYFTTKSNAEGQAAALKEAGFPVIIKEEEI